MRSFVRIPGPITGRSRSSRSSATAKRYTHALEANPDGPSQLERGDVREMDLRTANGLRAAIDGALYDIAQRFGLRYQVLRGRFGADGAVYKIGLEVKERPRTVRMTGTALIVPSSTDGKPLGSARVSRASAK